MIRLGSAWYVKRPGLIKVYMGLFTTLPSLNHQEIDMKSVLQTVNILIIAVAMAFLPESLSSATLPEDLTELSIEELSDIEVTSVSRKPQKLSHAAAAIFVITGEDIKRSGATSIPEALRMVPGIHVAKISSSKWAVTSRGFNSRYANKLLVQLDGRTLYSPLFSGVFWEAHDTLLDDIDRIEVVRGPGASLRGANAENGIINIITKHSSQTKGGLASGGGGTWDRAFASGRYGGSISSTGSYRIYTKYSSFADEVNPDKSGSDDDWQRTGGGFRSDFKLFSGSEVTLQGDVYEGKEDEVSDIITFSPPYSTHYKNNNDMSGFNLLGRITKQFSDSSDMAVQIYYDKTEKEESSARWKGELYDFDFQHRFTPFTSHEVILGLGFRHYQDDIDQNIGFTFDSTSEEDNLYSTFIQDSITFSETLSLVLGAKFEYNDYTEYEFQPSGRVSWSPHKSHHLWAAVSRAVRTPNRADTSILFSTMVIPPGTPQNPGALPAAITISGNDSIDSEVLKAFEVGYRAIPTETLSVDSTFFYYIYDNLSGFTSGTPYTNLQSNPPYLIMPLDMNNIMEGKTHGTEITVNWQPVPPLRIQASWSWFDMDIETGTAEISYTEDDAPTHQVSLRSMFDLPAHTCLDIWMRFVDEILDGGVDSYTELDVRVSWSPVETIEISVAGKNILDNSHPEYIESFLWGKPVEVERNFLGKISVKF